MKDVALVSPPGTSSPGTCDLATLFDQHFAYVWSTLVRLGVRSSDLEDVLQEVFLRLHTRLDRYDPERPIRPWIFGFAYRVAADYRRLARHRTEILGVLVVPVDPGRSADERIEVNEELARVETALQSVELERRAVLVMHDIDEVPIPA